MKTYIYNYKRLPFTPLNGALGTLAPPVSAAHLIEEMSAKENNYISKVDSFFLANAIDSSFGQNLINQIINHSNLSKDIERYRLKHGHITALKALSLASKIKSSGMQLTYAFENLTSIPNFVRNKMVKRRRDDDQDLDAMELSGLTRESYYVDGADELMWDIMERLSKDSKLDKNYIDKYAFSSRFKYRSALHDGLYNDEVLPAAITNTDKKTFDIARDQLGDILPSKERYANAKPIRKTLKFVTRANTSLPADGAVALLSSNKLIKDVKSNPIAEIFAYNEINGDPKKYADLGAQSIKAICQENKIDINDIDFFEMHENHPATILSQSKSLGFDVKKVNLKGGSISVGDPVSASGARLVSSACSIINQSKFDLGLINVSSPHGMSASMLIKRYKKT